MRFSALPTVLAASLVALPNIVVAGGEPENSEPMGVLLDISQVDPRNDPESAIFEPSLDTSDAKKAKAIPVPLDVLASGAAPAADEPVAAPVAVATEPKTILTNVTFGSDKQNAVATTEAATAAEQPRIRDNPVFIAVTDAMRPKDPVPALANDRISLYLSEKVAFAQYETTGERFNVERARTHVGFLYSEERDVIFQGGFAVDAPFWNSFRFSVGTRAYIALLNEENEDAFAAAIGAETAYQLPLRALPLEFGASFYYAPDILTFGTADRTIDAQVDVKLPIRSQFSIFGGYRFLQIDERPEDREVDNRIHLGIQWDFL